MLADQLESINKPRFVLMRLLFLSEGFIDATTFFDRCVGIKDALFTISPFNSASSFIDVWAAYKKSMVEGIAEGNSQNTALLFYIKNDKYETANPRVMLDLVRSIKITDCDGQEWDGGEIWIDDHSLPNNYNLVCTIVNDENDIGCNWMLPDEANRDSYIAHIAISSRKSCEAFLNPETMSAALLAREIGNIFGLGYEYEKSGAEFEIFDRDDHLPPNLTSHKQLFGDRNVADPAMTDAAWNDIVNNLHRSWFKRIERKRSKLKVSPHPTTQAEYLTLVNDSRDHFMLVQHAPSSSSPDDIDVIMRYISPKYKNLLNWSTRVNLIEGGAFYRRHVYRPSPECLMRWCMYPKKPGVFDVVPYCPVCKEFMQCMLCGFGSFKIDAVQLIPISPSDRSKPIKSTLAELLYKQICDEPVQNPLISSNPTYFDSMDCTALSQLRVENLFTSLNWMDWEYVQIPGGDNSPNWKRNDVYYPTKLPNIQGSYIHALWQSMLANLVHKPYAAAGAPGAVEASGLGLIANRTTGSGRIQNLKLDDLRNLPRGSLLQLWPSQQVYDYILDYICGGETASNLVEKASKDVQLKVIYGKINKGAELVDGKPRIVGHSMVYMGPEGGDLVAADQQGRNTSLTRGGKKGWIGDCKFLIAAQWFDIRI